MGLHEGIAYRLAYGQASELATTGGTLDQVLAEVLRRLRRGDPALVPQATTRRAAMNRSHSGY